jgi:hypothetical protein
VQGAPDAPRATLKNPKGNTNNTNQNPVETKQAFPTLLSRFDTNLLVVCWLLPLVVAAVTVTVTHRPECEHFRISIFCLWVWSSWESKPTAFTTSVTVVPVCGSFSSEF